MHNKSMKKYEPTQPLGKSLAREFFRIYGREPFSLKELYSGLGFTPGQVREAERIRLAEEGVAQRHLEPVIEANMRYWGEPFY